MCLPTHYTGGSTAGGSVSTAATLAEHGRCGERSQRQIGQVVCECNHMSTHSTWKMCLHDGSCRTISPSSKSSKHTEHSWALPHSRSASPSAPRDAYANVGNESIVALPSPNRHADKGTPTVISRSAAAPTRQLLGARHSPMPKAVSAMPANRKAFQTLTVATSTQHTSANAKDATTP